jgi:hypothetical protein
MSKRSRSRAAKASTLAGDTSMSLGRMKGLAEGEDTGVVDVEYQW